jgi:uncharacterized membrane protein
MRFVVAYIVTAIVFLGLDFIWLTQVALGMYRRELGALLLEQPNLPISAVFYLVFIAGIVLLAVFPALNGGGWLTALWMGAVLGLVAYGTYDITNLATLRNWSQTLVIVDLAWGTALTALSATIATLAIGWLRL